MTANRPQLRFVWNGIKDSSGRLQRAIFSDAELVNYPAGTITIYARDYSPFSAEVRRALTVQNASDSSTDYFETDSIRVRPSDPLYPQAKAALDARKAHDARKFSKVLEVSL